MERKYTVNAYIDENYFANYFVSGEFDRSHVKHVGIWDISISN